MTIYGVLVFHYIVLTHSLHYCQIILCSISSLTVFVYVPTFSEELEIDDKELL